MSPETLLETLEQLGTIDPKSLQKIRQEIENPKKTVKAKAILNYLVKKQQISETDAVRLLKGKSIKPKKADDFEVSSPKVEYDTHELMGVPEAPAPEVPVTKKRPAPVDIDATLMDEGQFTGGDEVVEVQPIEVPSQADEIVPIEVDEGAVVDEMAELDEFEGGYDGLHSSPASVKRKLGFSGKIDLRDQWATKWLYIGFGLLGFMIIIGGVLFIATMGKKAEDQFKAAMESFEKSAFQDAVAKFDEYIEDNPGHKHVPTAKARRLQSILAGNYTSRNWSETITNAGNLLPAFVEEEDSQIDLIREDLAVMLPRSLFEITEQAKKTTDLKGMQEVLEKIVDYKKVIDNPAYIPTSQRKKPTTANNLAKIDNNIRTIEGQINKEKEYRVAIGQIRELGDAGETDQAFATFTKLTRNYGDLAGREELINTMLEISLKERELVKVAAVELPVSATAESSPIVATGILGTRVGDPVDDLKGEVANFMAEGSVYGINIADGRIAWRQFVGYQTTIQPQLLNKDSLLVVNQQKQELLLLAKSSGQIIWRTKIGEPFLSPSFNDNQIVVTTESGKLIQIDPQTGKSLLSAQLPQNANVGALVAERDPFIYQPGFYSNLYVISNQDLSCREVYYLGHYKGSIAIPPTFWSGYIVVAINGGDYCDLHVLRPEANGLELKLVQVITRVTNGPVTTPLRKFGRWMLVTADNGEIRILELLPSEEKSPIRQFAADRFDNSSGQRAFVLTEGSNLWIASQGVSRFRIQRNQGQFSRDDIVDHADTFLAPLQKFDDKILHVRRRQGSGMLSATLVDAQSLEEVWRTDFGGQLVGSPLMSGDSMIAISNQGDLFRFNVADLDAGYIDTAMRASNVVDDLQFETMLELGGGEFACVGPPGKEDLLYGQSNPGSVKLVRLAPPANDPACQPLGVGSDLIVPSLMGQVTRVDAKTGRLVGIPFQPPISPGSKTAWLEPVRIDADRIAVATGAGEADKQDGSLYLLDISDRKRMAEADSFKSSKPFKSKLVADEGQVYAVTKGADADQLVAFSVATKLAESGKLELPGRVVDGPWLVESGLLLKLDNDQLVSVGRDLSIRWSVAIANEQLAADPENLGSQILFTFRNGNLLVLEPSSGKTVSQYALRQPVIHRPARAGENMYFSGMDGTIHKIDLNKLSGAN
jgi:outer membrane protein assembly factor BamB